MKLADHASEAILNLFSSKLRSALALLGVLVGTASVVAMVSGGELATNEALKQFKYLGTDLLAVTISDSGENDKDKPSQTLTLSDVKSFRAVNPAIIDTAPYTQVFESLKYEGHVVTGNILGVTESFANIVHIDVDRGRFVMGLDGYAYFCVVGNKVAQQIQKLSIHSLIGQQIQIGKHFFTIIGTLKDWPESSFVYADVDNSILIPVLTSMSLSKYTAMNNIIMRLVPNSNIDELKSQLTQYIMKLLPNNHLLFRSPKELIASMTKQSQILTVFLGLMGSISLIVGGIGIMNIMLVSVVERKREIGIRLAIGAKRSHIRLLFLMESIMLSLVGGTLGVLIGILIAFIMTFVWHWQFTLFLLPPLIGFTVSVITGIFFGFYPAHKASQLNPIQALRSDG